MKQPIKIFSNIECDYFFDQLFPDFKIEIKKITDISSLKNNNNPSIVFYNQSNQKNQKLNKDIPNDCLIITNTAGGVSKNNFNSFKKQIHISAIISKIKKYLNDRKIEFHDVQIIEKKLFNFKKNKSCFLTDIESEILRHIFKTKKSTKEFIKKNILKIRIDIETNSLESHLTRIRKKLEKVETKILIQSKNDNLVLLANQKKLD